jgi:hypothetical protein
MKPIAPPTASKRATLSSALAGADQRKASAWAEIGVLTLLWITVALVFWLQNALIDGWPWPIALRLAVFDWGPWIVLSPFVLWLGRVAHIDQRTWRWAVPLHFAACLATVVLFEVIFSYGAERRVFAHFGPIHRMSPYGEGMDDTGFGVPPGPPPPHMWATFRRPGAHRFSHARFTFPVYCVLLAAAHAMAFHRRSLERERQAMRAEASLAEARLAMLQAKLNPHFLFNTLNSITHFVRESPQQAEDMIAALSELLRSVLANAEQREVSLATEMGFIDSYLAIQQIRFGERLQVAREIDAEALIAAVPTLLLQPLVENAVIHGIAPQRGGGKLTIKAACDGGRLRIEIADTGVGLDAPRSSRHPSSGLGLGITRERLSSLYDAQHTFALAANPGGGARAVIDIPFKEFGA